MVDNACIKRASIDSSWLRLIDAVPTIMEVAEASNSRTLPSVHFPRTSPQDTNGTALGHLMLLSVAVNEPVRIILCHVAIVQAVRLRKQADIQEGGEGEESVISTQEYIRKVVDDGDFKPGSWVSAVEFVNANEGIVSGCLGDIMNYLKNEKLDQVVTIIKYCALNDIGNLTITIKDLSGGIGVTSSGVRGSGVGGSGVRGSAMLVEEEIINFTEE
ncbi:hypothetical protein Tco_1135437 [Tanacetum coccineum]